ncbi:Uncharacterised protein [Mycobacteroides abscessus subsp. abscessus]|uniref:hypothetical protein n=1 Tax=Mycobacteroides abscessus TaxID=36809 RepID=UPI0009283CE3|nr:hypothetical protein [Mycobacteroides abscessus]MDO3312372.1 hypothetical protein [Mycobacteroides abscessus subsp. abscessus]MDO3344946.1 hypothetical protein [Mycobacteroides abscessus subsp. abscessus]SHP10021.1 Uncharacterised protein [Mycobacteroides abscessus subsp. abscessus]SHP23981.1 Uncharacterised protein [Mycobacteroides abscessus subsp. abscessus]SHP94889.1 Uncharacterised protein [Mycobacteroides abscessus subsp. abscessus]
MPSVTTTAELLTLLRRHYIKPGLDLPGGVFVPEVGGNGSWGASARADAIYVGFTTSSGRILVGHELKISRADWLNELNKPGKADQWADQCHAWYLVVNDPAIVKPGELPPGWGLMSPGPSRTRMDIHTTAAVKADHTPSWEAIRSVMARIDTLRAGAVAASVESRDQVRRRKYEKDVAEAVERRVKTMPETGEAAKRLKLIEDAIGAPIDWSDTVWSPDRKVDPALLARIGKAALALGGVESAIRQLGRGYNSSKEVRRLIDEYESKLAEFLAPANNTSQAGEVSA